MIDRQATVLVPLAFGCIARMSVLTSAIFLVVPKDVFGPLVDDSCIGGNLYQGDGIDLDDAGFKDGSWTNISITPEEGYCQKRVRKEGGIPIAWPVYLSSADQDLDEAPDVRGCELAYLLRTIWRPRPACRSTPPHPVDTNLPT